MCKNKIFNKLLFFSFVFLFVSVITHATLLNSAQSSLKKNDVETNNVSIQTQQKQIIKRLKNVENNILFSEQDKNGDSFKKKRL